ncbi:MULTISPECIES: site-specific integrase [unclassified Vibrio]|uniref:site-specific integrase n=1 Tax=unclassified Vibrio TaxID=2614977 RepID=UPI0010BDE6AE|nr:site-specific integrase [Vibrio sp. F13]TKF51859.1 site-specific integrase [Vibrio sp. F13]
MPSTFIEKSNPKNKHCTKHKVRARTLHADSLVSQKARTFSSKSKAQAFQKKLDTMFKNGDFSFFYGTQKHLSMSDVINACISSPLFIDLKAESASLLKRIALTPFGIAPANQLEAYHWFNLAKDMHVTWGNKSQTVAHNLSVLRSTLQNCKTMLRLEVELGGYADAMATARRKGYISRSEERTRRPTEDELNSIALELKKQSLNSRHKIHMLDVFEFALETAARRGEICSEKICWGNWNTENRTLTISNRKTPNKDKKIHSTFELSPKAIEIIERQPRGKDSDPIFPYKADSVSAAWQRTMTKLEIEDLHFHDLRAEALCRLYEANWSLPAISKVSGHRDLNILNNIYLRFYPTLPSRLAA